MLIRRNRSVGDSRRDKEMISLNVTSRTDIIHLQFIRSTFCSMILARFSCFGKEGANQQRGEEVVEKGN
jgi:hypothetical protein